MRSQHLQTLLFCALFVVAAYATNKDASILIVGSGPSGIAAASKLLENGFKNVEILEVENRFGGRIKSFKFGEAIVDEGAEYCHGEGGNLVHEMVKDLNLLKMEPRYKEAPWFYSNGSRLNEEFCQDAYKFLLEFEAEETAENEKVSLGDAFIKQYRTEFVPKYKNDKNLEQILKEIEIMAEKCLIVSEGAFNWQSVAALSHFEEGTGEWLLTWNGKGYRTILEVLMKNYPDSSKSLGVEDKIKLKHKVTKIDWSAKNLKIKVDYVDKSAASKSKTVDHVIFTPSLGVLKADHEKLFTPQLPASKIEAIDNLGYDGVIKVIQHFPTKWWKDEFAFDFLWNEEDAKQSLKEFKEGPNFNGSSWVTSLMSTSEAPNNPNVLISWISGELVPDIEQLPIETVKQGIHYVFKKFLGKEHDVIESDQIIISHWCTNPNFRGTYSYEKTNHFIKDVSYHEIMGHPLVLNGGKPGVLFAGEATNPIHFSTVHGAIESGFREAERLIKYYENQV